MDPALLNLILSRCGDALSKADRAAIEDVLSGDAGMISARVWDAISALEDRMAELEGLAHNRYGDSDGDDDRVGRVEIVDDHDATRLA
jgi:hypothetical protein